MRTLASMLAAMTRAFHLAAATLREIFDESAYARFLARTRSAPSPQTYAAFCRERESAQSRKPRCC